MGNTFLDGILVQCEDLAALSSAFYFHRTGFCGLFLHFHSLGYAFHSLGLGRCSK